jgi:threonine/homoserine/homoserine lactone efflux protein
LTFVVVSAVLIVTPGPDTAITTRNALRGGWRAASWTAGGVAVGQLLWAAATGAGLVAVLAASAIAFTVVKFAGAAYLTILGIRTLRGVFRPSHEDVPPPATERAGGGGWFSAGLVNNLLNPKCAAIFLSIYPQFVHPGDPPLRLLLMGGLFAFMTFTWLNILGALLARAGQRFGGRVRRTADAVAGTVLIGLGLRVAVSR